MVVVVKALMVEVVVVGIEVEGRGVVMKVVEQRQQVVGMGVMEEGMVEQLVEQEVVKAEATVEILKEREAF